MATLLWGQQGALEVAMLLWGYQGANIALLS